MRLIAILATFLVISHVAVAQERRALTETEVEVVKAGVTAVLRDPTSAIFGQIEAVHEVTGEGGSFDLNHIVCGTVNAKNGFGGYVGTAPFIGFLAISRDKPPRFKLSDLGSPDNYYTITKRCREHGIWP